MNMKKIFLNFVFRRYTVNDQKSNFAEEKDLWPCETFCEKKDGQSKRERMGITDLRLKRVFAG